LLIPWLREAINRCAEGAKKMKIKRKQIPANKEYLAGKTVCLAVQGVGAAGCPSKCWQQQLCPTLTALLVDLPFLKEMALKINISSKSIATTSLEKGDVRVVVCEAEG
jgi:hypothetical protein